MYNNKGCNDFHYFTTVVLTCTKTKHGFFPKKAESIGFFYNIKAPKRPEPVDDKIFLHTSIHFECFKFKMVFEIQPGPISLLFFFLSKACDRSRVKDIAIVTLYVLKKIKVTTV